MTCFDFLFVLSKLFRGFLSVDVPNQFTTQGQLFFNENASCFGWPYTLAPPPPCQAGSDWHAGIHIQTMTDILASCVTTSATCNISHGDKARQSNYA